MVLSYQLPSYVLSCTSFSFDSEDEEEYICPNCTNLAEDSDNYMCMTQLSSTALKCKLPDV